MRYLRIKYIFLLIAAITLVLIIGMMQGRKFSVTDYITIDKPIGIQPDYSDTVIPPNIAPLSFYIKEPAQKYYVRIYSDKGSPITIYRKTPKINIPLKRWRKLLIENKGNSLYFEIFVKKKEGGWERYRPIVNKIATEEIDSFLVYRYLYPQFYRKLDLKIYQRNLENYGRKLIMDARTFKGCFNCHTFLKNRPEKFIIQTRSLGEKYMILNDDNKICLVRPKLIKSGAAYLSWHPRGDLVALTMDMDYRIVNLFSGNAREEKLEYIDTDGNLAVYNITANTLDTVADIAREDRIEMQPAWSPDGGYLYFISAQKMPMQDYAKIKYDLMRISYDAQKNIWGASETVIASGKTGLSVTFPKISPDGRYLLFCMTDRGSLSIYRSSTDLYLMDIKTGEYQRLKINSDRADSYHSWSSNSRWFVFISKRDDGISARAYFCYIDEEGKVYKPFILPQKDPYFYDTFIKSYNAPELVTGSLDLNRFSFGKKIIDQGQIIDVTSIDGLTDIYPQETLPPDEYENRWGGGYQH